MRLRAGAMDLPSISRRVRILEGSASHLFEKSDSIRYIERDFKLISGRLQIAAVLIRAANPEIEPIRINLGGAERRSEEGVWQKPLIGEIPPERLAGMKANKKIVEARIEHLSALQAEFSRIMQENTAAANSLLSEVREYRKALNEGTSGPNSNGTAIKNTLTIGFACGAAIFAVSSNVAALRTITEPFWVALVSFVISTIAAAGAYLSKIQKAQQKISDAGKKEYEKEVEKLSVPIWNRYTELFDEIHRGLNESKEGVDELIANLLGQVVPAKREEVERALRILSERG
ncbi:hypothetical protein HY988_07535 [Candidatus Micrarchaeota archaeon]|nr:hypothetical protein [Candidatus Micrarchaeota archaeon]